MTVPSTHLAVLSQASQLLAEATTIDEVKFVRDKAEVVRSYIQAARMGLEAQNEAAEMRLRAERKAGAMLGSLKLHGGNHRSKSPRVTLKLEALGISRNQSVRWQRLAAISEAEFAKYLAAAKRDAQEITSSGLLRSTCKKCQRATAARHPLVITNGQAATANLEESFAELTNHCQLLQQILGFAGPADGSELTAADRRIAGGLVTEIGKLIQHIRKSVPPGICDGCTRFLP